MKRLGLIIVLLFATVLSISALGFADGAAEQYSVEEVAEIADEIQIDKGFVDKPKDFILTTVSDAFILSGTAKENDKLTITLYKRVGNSFVPMGESVEIKIGPLGIFTKEVSLKDEQTKSPKETTVSKETFVVLELKRGDTVTWDYRLIRFTDDKEVKKSLDTLKSSALVPTATVK